MRTFDSVDATSIVAVWAVLLGVLALACATSSSQEESDSEPEPEYEEVEPYEPEFSYSFETSDEGEDADIAVGIIEPDFDAEFEDKDATRREMAKAVESGLKEALQSKGFTFETHKSVDDMTYPQKKQVHFVLHMKLDYQTKLKAESAGTEERPECTWEVEGKMTIGFEAVEPMSGETIWVKNLEPEAPDQSLTGPPDDCRDVDPRYVDRAPTLGKNAWAKGHEALYKTVMEEFEKFINIEELRNVTKSAKEIRKKTRF